MSPIALVQLQRSSPGQQLTDKQWAQCASEDRRPPDEDCDRSKDATAFLLHVARKQALLHAQPHLYADAQLLFGLEPKRRLKLERKPLLGERRLPLVVAFVVVVALVERSQIEFLKSVVERVRKTHPFAVCGPVDIGCARVHWNAHLWRLNKWLELLVKLLVAADLNQTTPATALVYE